MPAQLQRTRQQTGSRAAKRARDRRQKTAAYGRRAARTKAFTWAARRPESADCARMDRLKALRADLLTPEEKEELKRLEARYPDVPLDRTRDAPLASEAVRL